VTRVGLLAPMRQELAPLVRRLALRRAETDTALYVGLAGRVEVVASLAGIGMRAATAATERLLDATKLDHVLVVGIAGGVDAAQPIGALIAPEVVVDGATGREFRPVQLGELPPHGRLVTWDRLVTGLEEAAELKQSGVVGLDMETAAVAAVCERRGCPWSVFRAISDRVTDGTTDPAVLALAGADGSGDLAAVARYLLARPWRIVRLARLAHGTLRATRAAADAAIRACARLGESPELA
jgi:adenosylhomocysteine nucleosidase